MCTNLGRISPFSWQKLQSLYGSAEAYARQVENALDELLAEGWLTPADSLNVRQELIPAALE